MELARLLERQGCVVLRLHEDEPADLVCVNRANRTIVIKVVEGKNRLKMSDVPLELARVGSALGTPIVAWKPKKNPGYPHGWVFIPILGVRRSEELTPDHLPPNAMDLRTVATQPISPV